MNPINIAILKSLGPHSVMALEIVKRDLKLVIELSEIVAAHMAVTAKERCRQAFNGIQASLYNGQGFHILGSIGLTLDFDTNELAPTRESIDAFAFACQSLLREIESTVTNPQYPRWTPRHF